MLDFHNTFLCCGFLCARLISLYFCLYFVSLSGYHAEGYHVPSLPPRAITPVYTSRLPHQSCHAPPIHVHRVITPAISNSYFIVYISPAFTPPLLLHLHHHRAPHATTCSTWYVLGATGFRFFSFFFWERTRPAAGLRPPCVIYISTGNMI